MALMAIDERLGGTIHNIDEKRPKASLLEKVGATTAVPMYCDTADGEVQKVGYVVSYGRGIEQSWFRFYRVEPWSNNH